MEMKTLELSITWKLIIGFSVIGLLSNIAIHSAVLIGATSKLSPTSQQMPIQRWQNQMVATPLKVRSQDPVSMRQYLESLTSSTSYLITEKDTPHAQLNIHGIAIVDNNSHLVFATPEAPVSAGDIGSQLPIRARDDLADALMGHRNSGIELLSNNNYLVIKSIKNKQDEIIGATVSWQSWQYLDESRWLDYRLIVEALSNAIRHFMGSFIWLLPSSIILGWLVSIIVHRRLRHLYATIEDWGKGHLQKRIHTTGNDEIAVSFQRLNQMAEHLQRHQQQLEQIASIEERQRLAAELHDTVKQELFAANLQFSAAQQCIETNNTLATQYLSQGITQNTSALKQLNNVIFTLSPIDSNNNLSQSLEAAMEDWKRKQSIQLSYNINIPHELSDVQQQVVFRTTMEALQNISKHSNATEVEVTMHSSDTHVRWQVKDNGSCTAHLCSNSTDWYGQGLSLMQKRLLSLQGHLTVTTAPCFTLTMEFPFD